MSVLAATGRRQAPDARKDRLAVEGSAAFAVEGNAAFAVEGNAAPAAPRLGHRRAPRMALGLLLLVPAILAGCGQPPADRPGESTTPPDAKPSLAAQLEATLALLTEVVEEGDADEMVPVLETAVSAGKDLRTWPDPANPAAQYANSDGEAPTQHIARMVRARALAALPENATLVELLVSRHANGTFPGPHHILDDDLWALRALHAAAPGRVPREAIEAVKAAQGSDGGWAWRTGAPATPEVTGLALVTMAELGELQGSMGASGRAFLLARQGPDGGFGSTPGTPSNCYSAAWAIRGLDATGDVPAAAWEFLASLRKADGSYAYSPGFGPHPPCAAHVGTLMGDAIHGRVALPP